MPRINFKGKALVVNHHLAVPFCELKARKDLSVLGKGQKVSLHDNLILHGDNLLALKALLPTHAGKINCIYIDPPYNTGNEGWCYNDNVANPMIKEWLGKVVDKDDLTRHDKWLCMMYPRLSLLYELLAEDGVIFVSIDDNEVHRLRMVMDEIFGEDNFRNELILRRYSKNISRQFMDKGMKSLAVGYERILAYTKSLKHLLSPVFREAKNERGEVGYWKGFWNAANRPTMRYTLLGITPEIGQWKWKKSIAEAAVKNYQEYMKKFSHISLEQYWSETGENKKFIRRREDLMKGKNKGVEHWVSPSEGILLSSDWMDMIASKDASKFNIDFYAPKNVNVIKRLIEMTVVNQQNTIILDSFAGSGTTAHAVLSLNKEDGGNRKFVLVECEKYADKITAERVRRVIKGVPKAKDENLKDGLGGGFSYWELGAPIKMKSILTKGKLPEYEDLARYIFYTATGEEWNPKNIKKRINYIGDSRLYEVYLLYKADIKTLKETALTLEMAENLPPAKSGKTRIVFAPVRYVNEDELQARRIKYCQLPFEIYKMAGDYTAKKSPKVVK